MRLGFGIAGHRGTNPAYRENCTRIERALDRLLSAIDAASDIDVKP